MPSTSDSDSELDELELELDEEDDDDEDEEEEDDADKLGVPGFASAFGFEASAFFPFLKYFVEGAGRIGGIKVADNFADVPFFEGPDEDGDDFSPAATAVVLIAFFGGRPRRLGTFGIVCIFWEG